MLLNALMYTLHQFCFQMEFCICQYNFLFSLWHIATCLWSSVAVIRYLGIVLWYALAENFCWQKYHHTIGEVVSWKKKLHSNRLANSTLKPSSVWNLFLSEDGIVQSFPEGTDVILVLKKSCCKETVASICLLSDGLLLKTIKTHRTWDSQPALKWHGLLSSLPTH